jgi:small subunit ribosomal protein S21
MAHNNAVVVLDDQMPLDKALKQLKKALSMNGTSGDLKRREHYVKPSLARRMKSKRARAKLAKQARRKSELSESMELQMKERIQQRKGVI